jgi:hypothetical protein
VSALAKLPDLLSRVDLLESDVPLCRRRHCYAEVFSWLPYCDDHQLPTFLFREPARLGADRYGLSRYALLAEYRLGLALRPSPLTLSPFVVVSAC